MTQPSEQPNTNELDAAIDAELDRTLGAERPGSGGGRADPPRPVEPVAGAGAMRGAPPPPHRADFQQNAALQQMNSAAMQSNVALPTFDPNTGRPFRDLTTNRPAEGTLQHQLAALNADADRMIATLKDMQQALAVIRRKLG